VAEAVVHVLEAVEIHDHHCDVSTNASSSAEGLFEAVIEQGPVRESGERVVRCLVSDRVLRPGAHDRRQQDAGDGFDELLVVMGELVVCVNLDEREWLVWVADHDATTRRTVGFGHRVHVGLGSGHGAGELDVDLADFWTSHNPTRSRLDNLADGLRCGLDRRVETRRLQHIAPEVRDRFLVLQASKSFRDITGIDDYALHGRILEPIRREPFEPTPGPVRMTDPEAKLSGRARHRHGPAQRRPQVLDLGGVDQDTLL
jgi:hypothetical protein